MVKKIGTIETRPMLLVRKGKIQKGKTPTKHYNA
jgi:hypothetical protein